MRNIKQPSGCGTIGQQYALSCFWLAKGRLDCQPRKIFDGFWNTAINKCYMDPDLVSTGGQEIALDCIKRLGNGRHFLKPLICKSATALPLTSLSYRNETILKVGRRRERFRCPSAHMRFISKSLRNLSRLRLRSCGGMRWRILLRAAKVKVAQQPIFSS